MLIPECELVLLRMRPSSLLSVKYLIGGIISRSGRKQAVQRSELSLGMASIGM